MKYRVFLVLLTLTLLLGLTLAAGGWGIAYGQTPGEPTVTALTATEEAALAECAGTVIAGFRVEGTGQVSIGLSELGTLPAGTEAGGVCTYLVGETCTLASSTYDADTQMYGFTASESGVYGFYACPEGVPGPEITPTGGGAVAGIAGWLVAGGAGLGLAGIGLLLRRRFR
jgi:hypothetical protein